MRYPHAQCLNSLRVFYVAVRCRSTSLIVSYLKKIEIECEAGCEDKTTYHSLLVLLDYVEACNKEDKDRVVAEAAAQFESWNLEVARTISTTKMETKVTVLTRVSVLHPIKV